MHSCFFVLSAFDETALILKPVGDARERVKVVRAMKGAGGGKDGPLITPGEPEKDKEGSIVISRAGQGDSRKGRGLTHIPRDSPSSSLSSLVG
jgi:hypothetical protein